MVFYSAGTSHRNVVGEVGFEQIEIEFDAAWLGSSALPREPVLTRVGGPCGVLAHSIAVQCGTQPSEPDTRPSEPELRMLIRRLLALAHSQAERPLSAWIDHVTSRLRADPGQRIAELAREVERSPAWIGPAYRSLIGEGLQQVAARGRIERAARLLRESDEPLSTIAMEAGFCDQSHMNRSFRRVLGRLPTAVREDRQFLRKGR